MLEQLIGERLPEAPCSTAESEVDGVMEIHFAFANDSNAEALARLVEAAAARRASDGQAIGSWGSARPGKSTLPACCLRRKGSAGG